MNVAYTAFRDIWISVPAAGIAAYPGPLVRKLPNGPRLTSARDAIVAI
jgi:hypothetical protein